MGELRPSRESADRLLALGLTDQRRPLYEVLEVELLRADALRSSTQKNEETTAPDKEDWPPSGVGTGNSRTEGSSRLEGEGQGPDGVLRPTGQEGGLLEGEAHEETRAEQSASPQSLGPGSAALRDEGKDNNNQTQEPTLLKGEHQEGICRKPCQIEGRKDLDEAEIQALHRQGGSGSEARHDFPWSSVAAPGLQGATERDPPPRGAAKSHPVLLGEGRGPDGVLRPTEEQEVELFEGSGQNASTNKGKDRPPELPPGGDLLKEEGMEGAEADQGENSQRAAQKADAVDLS